MRMNKKKILGVIGGVAALAFLNAALSSLYPGNFSFFAYILFIIIPLIAVVIIVFTKFSVLFLNRISEKEEEGLVLERRQKEIVENMIEGLVVHDKDGRVLSVNSAAENFIGVTEKDLKGDGAFKIAAKNSFLANVLKKEMKEKEEMEYSFVNETGQELYYLIIKVTLNEEKGEILKIIRDVSRVKYLDKMKTEYVTIMSHKFLTPLTNIKWAAGEIIGKDANKEKQEKNLNNIINNADKLVKLTSDLLDITDIEEGLFGYKMEDLDMSELVTQMAASAKEESDLKEIKVTYHSPADSNYIVRGDKSRIGAAVANYLTNSIKYTPVKGKIDLYLEKAGEFIKFVVKDSGMGVSPEAVSSLFTKFFRDKKAKEAHTEGSGLGLFIVKNIIKRHGGDAGFQPREDGPGSVFYFTLPVANTVIEKKSLAS
ncbi:TPA: hypothetical protein DEW47_02710 [Patescibacteria group bacterium]|nr:MAG: Multi-sensor signal transduction histidine kinase [Parcubacteria group bacterium GW2011_GWF2_40_10]KKR47231.1 MAG: Multi-sensor signal transduction histidine kinase [Parcubacteria group bacterium GW2011_GWA2_40_143]KKR60195.1 MAG: Multi-sensor signal transduction histidine kinase [Parcubacteria group bacterium GW2011_GWC2_40_31]KKR77275.1 MAG: Multi-sensor signal transduction histidine kinase [Parcubacteria group bacterium GW2011_GWE2_40_8]KKR83409.1 MAG: Multi-sensor signal transductio